MTPQERDEWDVNHKAKSEARRVGYEQHLTGVKAKLHAFSAGELELSPRQLHKLEWNLAVLQFRLKHGHQTRWSNGLPDKLDNTNPQHVKNDFIRIIGNIGHKSYSSWKKSSGFQVELSKYRG